MDFKRLVGAATAGLAVATGPCGGDAQAPAASVAVYPANTPAFGSESDLAQLREGLAAAKISDWAGVRLARYRASDPTIKRILTWRLASSYTSDAPFAELDQALGELAGWPGAETTRRRAEQAIFDSALAPAARIAWLTQGGIGPLTGDGQMALAQAYARMGRRADALSMAREVWRERALTPRAESVALSEFGAAFTLEDHAARVDRLLWRDDRSEARRLLPRLAGADRAVAEARIALQARPRKGLQKLVDAVPAARRDDPGLLFDRARYMRADGRPEDALAVIARIRPLDAAPSVRETLFSERRLYVPRALRAGQKRTAYTLVAEHGLTDGEKFADGEWLAGWLALKFLAEPGAASAHFARLDNQVSTPVSKARALYWRGEAARALGQASQAQSLLAQAAAFSFTYYGQLAATRQLATGQGAAPAGPPPLLALTGPDTITPEIRAAFESKELVRALRLINQAGDRASFELICFYLDDQFETAAEHALLAELAVRNALTRTAVRSAKAGLRRGLVAADAAYPLMPLPPTVLGPGLPEPALVLAITRQESEFDPAAVSPAGARGLMQLMPATARLTARQAGLPYDLAQLTLNPDYNLTLGAAYLQSLIDDFGGSYILAVASYNAGPSRAREWIADWGDPRMRGVDPVDWVELIPFAETRNYVQRVMENLQVYRHRLAGAPTPIRLDQDLKRGG